MSELPRATGRYLVLGLLIVVALVLAVREFMRPHGRGEPDEWMRVLLVHGDERPYFPRVHHAGFQIHFDELDEVVASGRSLLDNADAPPLAAAMVYADEQGYGFLLLDMREGWDLSTLDVEPPAGSLFVAIGIGDVARQGTRVCFGAPETGPFAYVDVDDSGRDMLDTTAIQLALFEHPDLVALFEDHIDGPLAQRSRWALDQGLGHQHHSELLQTQQRRLAELDGRWPSPRPGNLGDRWEQVRAVPVRGGVLIERRPVWLNVADSVRAATLQSEGVGELAFVPIEALAAGADPVAARRACVGTREREVSSPHKLARRASSTQAIVPSFGVSPDGRMLVLPRSYDSVDVHRINVGPDACTLDWVRMVVSPTPALPELGNSGNLGWVLRGDQLWWHAAEEHGITHEGATAGTKLAWSSAGVLAALGEGSVILLLHVDAVGLGTGSDALRARLDAGLLFPGIEHDDPAATVLEIHPANDALFVVTKACPAAHALGVQRRERRCLHRVDFRTPLAERLGRTPQADPIVLGRRDIVVHTLGSIDAYASLAIATEGSRVAYVDVDDGGEASGLFAVDVRERELGPARRVADVHRSAQLMIDADGRVVVVEEPVQIVEHGTRTMARAFVL